MNKPNQEEIIGNNDIIVDINNQMDSSYLDYSMSVIIGRALPDSRDGLKPVHRRIIYAMNDLGITSNTAYKKSARIVGDVIGKYHPHGDISVYDALVRMAQDFSMSIPIIEGQGNFGSVDGDSPAAMRYTESRFSDIAELMIKDIKKDTVDWGSNYDDTLTEPMVLPTRVPNLLLNGSEGIAVGMATKIPPHNLNELINAVLELLDNPFATVEDLMVHLKGPDLPTGGIVSGKEGIKRMYETGKGLFKIKSKYHIEEKNGKESIIIDEIPFLRNKANIVIKINELAKEKVIEGISELRDESNREGIRIVIDVKRDAMSEIVINNIFKHTELEISFSATLLAIHNKEPKILSLLEILNIFISHRKSVVIRRTIFDLKINKKNLEIREGIVIALENIDEVVRIIKSSSNSSEARKVLEETYNLTELQTNSILEMRLSRLTSMEIEKLEIEISELKEVIKELEEILGSETKLINIIKDELIEINNKYKTPRRSKIEDSYENYSDEDLIPNEPMVVTLTQKGYIKRVNTNTYERQNRGGKGKIGIKTFEDDIIKNFLVCDTHDNLLCVTDRGSLYHLKVYKIPEGNRNSKGKAIVNLINLKPDEKIVSTLFVKELSKENEDMDIVFITKKGIIKRTKLSEFANVRNVGIKAINLDDDDSLVTTKIKTDQKYAFVVTKEGISLKFDLEDLKVIGRNTRGVKSIRFKKEEDFIIDMDLFSDDEEVITISEKGLGKISSINDYKSQNRGGKGIIAMKLSEKTGRIAGMLKLSNDERFNSNLLAISSEGKIIRISFENIKQTKRITQGVKMIDIEEGSIVTNITKTNIEKEFEEEFEEGIEGEI